MLSQYTEYCGSALISNLRSIVFLASRPMDQDLLLQVNRPKQWNEYPLLFLWCGIAGCLEVCFFFFQIESCMCFSMEMLNVWEVETIHQ